MYENIPTLPDMMVHQTPESMVEDCEKIVEWAEQNLAIVNRAEGMKHYFHLTENQKLTIALAYLIHENVVQLNQLILEFKWPNTWIDAFKIRWFPKWLLKHFPAMETRITVTAQMIYPSIAPKLPDHENYFRMYVKESAATYKPK